MPQAIHALQAQIMAQANSCPYGQFMMGTLRHHRKIFRYRACPLRRIRFVVLGVRIFHAPPVFAGLASHNLLKAAVKAALRGVPALCGNVVYIRIGVLQKIAGVVDLDIAHVIRICHAYAAKEKAGEVGFVIFQRAGKIVQRTGLVYVAFNIYEYFLQQI